MVVGSNSVVLSYCEYFLVVKDLCGILSRGNRFFSRFQWLVVDILWMKVHRVCSL